MATAVASRDFTASSNNYMTDGSGFVWANNSWTAVCWFNYHGDSGSTTFQTMMSSTAAANVPLFYAVNWSSNVNKLVSFMNNTGLVGTTTLSANTWYFAATTFDGGSGTGNHTLYLGTTNSAVAQEATQSLDLTYTTNNGVRLGRYGALPSFDFDGEIAYAGVWSRALSLGELQDVQFNPNAVVDSPVGIWPLHTSDSSTVKDISTAGNNMTVNSSPAVSTDGPPVFLLGGV